MQANQNILDRRHFTEELNVLEGACDTRQGDIGRSLTNHAFTCVQHITCSRCVNTSQHVHHRALTGSVRTDQTMDGAALDTEINFVQCL